MTGKKKTNITPTLKRSKKEDLGNYKLFGHSSVPGRFTKQILLEAVPKHMKGEGDVGNTQYGCTKP